MVPTRPMIARMIQIDQGPIRSNDLNGRVAS